MEVWGEEAVRARGVSAGTLHSAMPAPRTRCYCLLPGGKGTACVRTILACRPPAPPSGVMSELTTDRPQSSR